MLFEKFGLYRRFIVFVFLDVKLILKSNPNLVILLFTWSPKNDDAFFIITVERIHSKQIIKIAYKFIEDKRCFWTNSEFDYYNTNDQKQEEVNTVEPRGSTTLSGMLLTQDCR